MTHWSSDLSQVHWTTNVNQGRLWGLAISPDGKIVATSGQTIRLRLWSAETRQELTDTLSEGDEVLPFSFSPDSTRLLTGGREGTARLWTLGRRELPLWMAHPGAVTHVMFSPDGRALLTASAGKVRLWSAQNGKPLEVAIPALTDWGFPAAWFGSDGRTLIGRLETDRLAMPASGTPTRAA